MWTPAILFVSKKRSSTGLSKAVRLMRLPLLLAKSLSKVFPQPEKSDFWLQNFASASLCRGHTSASGSFFAQKSDFSGWVPRDFRQALGRPCGKHLPAPPSGGGCVLDIN